MAEHKHEWGVTVLGSAVCVTDWDSEDAYGKQCMEKISNSEVERRLNAFDALVEALEDVQRMAETDPSNLPLKMFASEIAGRCVAALRLARGDSEVRA